MQLSKPDQCRQKALIEGKCAFKCSSFGLGLAKRPPRCGEVQPQLGGVRIATASIFQMVGGAASIASCEGVQPQGIARERLSRIERENRFEMSLRIGRAA